MTIGFGCAARRAQSRRVLAAVFVPALLRLRDADDFARWHEGSVPHGAPPLTHGAHLSFWRAVRFATTRSQRIPTAFQVRQWKRAHPDWLPIAAVEECAFRLASNRGSGGVRFPNQIPNVATVAVGSLSRADAFFLAPSRLACGAARHRTRPTSCPSAAAEARHGITSQKPRSCAPKAVSCMGGLGGLRDYGFGMRSMGVMSLIEICSSERG